jgi:membrane protease YdiL (CAAX protease family)
MGEENLTPKVTTAQTRPGTAFDLVLYLLGGFGLYLVASGVYGFLLARNGQIVEITLPILAIAISLNVIFIGGSPYVLGILRKKLSWVELGLFPPKWKPTYLLIAAGLAIGIMPVRGLIGLLFQYLIEGGFESLEFRNEMILAGGVTWPGFVVTLLGVGILAPFAEEFYFRGLLHNWFRQHVGFWWSIFLSSALFGLAHIDSVGVLVSSFLMGLVMAYAFERTRSLWITIAIHVITNSTAVVLLYAAMFLSQYFNLPF